MQNVKPVKLCRLRTAYRRDGFIAHLRYLHRRGRSALRRFRFPAAGRYELRALCQRLRMTYNLLYFFDACAAHRHKRLFDGNVINSVYAKRAGKEHIRHLPDLARIAVFKRDDSKLTFAGRYRVICFLKAVFCDGGSVRKQFFCRKEGKCALFSAICDFFSLNQLALISLGRFHYVPLEAYIIRADVLRNKR